jgi:hypothetical protein
MDTIHPFHYGFYDVREKMSIDAKRTFRDTDLAFEAIACSPALLLDENAASRIFPDSMPNGYRQVSRV